MPQSGHGVDLQLPLRQTGLRADHVLIKRGSDRVLERSRISLSHDGLRVEQSRTGMRMVLNYSEQKFWLVDLSRGVQHEVPANFVDLRQTNETDQAVLDRPRDIQIDSGLLAVSACAGLTVDSAFDAIWRALPVTISECSDGDGQPVVRHWFNARIGLVIRTMDTEGRIEELRTVKPARFPSGYFSVSPSLRKVAIKEFFTGAKTLQRYFPEVTAASSQSIRRRHDSPRSLGSMSQFKAGSSSQNSPKE